MKRAKLSKGRKKIGEINFFAKIKSDLYLKVTLYRAIPQREPKEMAQLVLKYKREVRIVFSIRGVDSVGIGIHDTMMYFAIDVNLSRLPLFCRGTLASN